MSSPFAATHTDPKKKDTLTHTHTHTLPHIEHKFLHALDTLYQIGASAASLDRRDRTSLVGSYYAGSTRGGRPSQFPYPYSYPGAAAAAAAVAAVAASAKPVAMGEEEEGAFDDREVQYDDEEELMIDRCVLGICLHTSLSTH